MILFLINNFITSTPSCVWSHMFITRKSFLLEENMNQFMNMSQRNFEEINSNIEASNKNIEASIKNRKTPINNREESIKNPKTLIG